MSSNPVVVRVADVSKRFVIRKDKSLKERLVNFGRSQQHKDDFWALENVDLEITAGSTVGLIGPNGSGKSTLLKMIGGILQPTSGTVEHRGRIAALLELGAGFHPDLTGRENVYLNASILGLSNAQTESYFDEIVEFSGIEKFIDTQVKFYSSGMYVRLAFSVAVHVDPEILLVDEVLSVGDEPFQRKCMDKIRRFQEEGRTIILVTHSLDQVADICDHAVLLEGGKVIVDGDPVDALRHLRADFDAIRQADLAKQRVSTRAPDSTAQVVGVSLFDDNDQPTISITTGDALKVRIATHFDEPAVADAVVGMFMDTSLGQIVYGTNTKLLEQQIPAAIGDRVFTFRMGSLPLVEGTYGITAAIGRQSGVELHRLTGGASLEVRGNGFTIGVLDVPSAYAETEATAADIAAREAGQRAEADAEAAAAASTDADAEAAAASSTEAAAQADSTHESAETDPSLRVAVSPGSASTS
ncbi:ABC transporter ATP-binding protein [Nakamurella sp. A5-74]|uniref:ABC transporter ATP-binding protein n=1 Tax=Nakamurella sp. A5-74 TaxID=3158264 RepID=A0AAU8DLJ6_9ACTN